MFFSNDFSLEETELADDAFAVPAELDYETDVFVRWPHLRVPPGDPQEYFFDPDSAYRAVAFFINELCHIEGPKRGFKLSLEPWQQYIIEQIFGWKKRKDGLRRFREVFIFIPRKNGKALALDTPILTTEGWKKLGNVQVGDYVFSERGEPTRVKAKSEVQDARPCYQLEFSCGEKIIADSDHEWLCRYYRGGTYIRTTSEIFDFSSTETIAFPVAKAIKLPEKELPIDPYDVGLAILSPKRYAELLYEIDNLEVGMTISKGKIPNCYFLSSMDQRLRLMHGVMDASGQVSYGGGATRKKTGLVWMKTANEATAVSFSTLLFSLGFFNRITTFPTGYRVTFSAYSDQSVFSNQSKQGQLPHRPRRGASKPRLLKNIKRVKSVPVVCIEVENETSLYCAGHNLIPTHNSFLGAGLALLGLYALDEPGPKIVSAAADTEQAALIYDTAKKNVDGNPRLSQGSVSLRRTLSIPGEDAKYEVISSDAHTKHGKNLSMVVIDEVHAIPNRELIEVLFTSVGARDQPLKVMLTTAGFDKTSICYEYYEHAKNVIKNPDIDPEFFPVMFEADPNLDWKDEENWFKANPNLGVSISLDYFKSEVRKALERPSYENAFKRLHLNMWTSSETCWVSQEVWDACATPVDMASLAGRECYIGVDLASRIDLTAVVLAFPTFDVNGQVGAVDVLPFFWMPQENIHERRIKDRIDYATWVDKGFIEATPGKSTDYDRIRQKIKTLGETYKIRQILFDPWNALQLMGQLEGDSFETISIPQSVGHLSGATKELEALLLSQRIRHGGHPTMKWMFGNITIRTDASGNIKIDREKSREKIDGIAALILAIRGILGYEPEETSVYESRGLRTF